MPHLPRSRAPKPKARDHRVMRPRSLVRRAARRSMASPHRMSLDAPSAIFLDAPSAIFKVEQSMEGRPMERRLAAILAADVVGYSHMMAEDEAGTYDSLRSRLPQEVGPNTETLGRKIFLTHR